MRLALAQAAGGIESVSPNPMVGAVLVRGDRVLAQGFHRRFGGPHAEVDALRQARDARGADLYVTLEPCAHHGKTPPCTDAILAAGVRRVIFGVSDPNPLTRGQGPVVLRRAGVEVAGGVLRQEAERLIAPYLHWRRSGLPWVILKWAMSLDGKTATASGESRWITGSKSRAAAHGLRRRVDAVLVGTETALRDDPLLTPRPARGRKPLRVVLDRRGRLPLDLRLLRRLPPGDAGGPVLYVASKRTGSRRLAELRRRGLEVLIVGESERGLDLHEILAALAQRDVSQLLVEGGGRLAAGFVEGGWASEVAAFVAPRLLGGAGAPTPLAGLGFAELARSPWLREVEVRMLDRDLCISGRVAGRGRPMVPLFDTRGR